MGTRTLLGQLMIVLLHYYPYAFVCMINDNERSPVSYFHLVIMIIYIITASGNKT